MFGEKFKRKYALTDLGLANVKKGTAWTVVVNLVVMGGISFLYLLMLQFMGTLLNGEELPSLLLYLLALIAFIVVSFIVHVFQYKATYGVVYDQVEVVRVNLAERMRKLPMSFFGRFDTADIAETILADVSRLEHVWSHVLGYLYGSYISTAIVFLALLFFDWRLAIASCWGVPVGFALLFGLRRIASSSATIAREAGVEVSDGLQEMIEDIREIRATNQEERYLAGLDAKIDEYERKTVRSELSVGIAVNSAQMIMRLGIATTVLAGALLIAGGQLEFMVLFMFLLVITRIYAPFDQALALIAEVFATEGSVARLNRITDEAIAEGSEQFDPQGHTIVFDNVSFAYGDESVLDGVSFVAKEGEVTALVGPSGSGKSTCARLAARLWDVKGGHITLGGVDISTVDPETLMSSYSMVFQDVMLFDDSVMGNIRLGRHGATDEEVLAAAKAANCDEFVSKLPQGYDTVVGENGARLSGGERQRISIARALLKDAPVVLLDEATASLDVESESRVQEALSRLLADKTVLVIAHRMRTVENADHLVVFKDGKVAEDGSPADLRERENGIYRRMAELQAASAGWAL